MRVDGPEWPPNGPRMAAPNGPPLPHFVETFTDKGYSAK